MQTSEATTNAEREIERLMYRYARTADSQLYHEWLELFTEDAIYTAITLENDRDQGLALFTDYGKERMKERVAFFMGFWAAERGKTLHQVSNIEVTDVTGDQAVAVSYFVIYRTGDDGESKLYACGEYQDELANSPTGWLFQKRRVIVDADVLPSQFSDLL
jgi:3-phenylpropionate/cinnamic acid dioxygenase small subunit